MAAVFKIHRETYGRLERGDKIHQDLEITNLGGLSEPEKCLILRKRSGRTQQFCAKKMGVTRYWFNRMEIGKVSCEPLVEFWRKNAG